MAYLKKFSLTLKNISRKTHLKFWTIIALITLIGLSTVGNYGISWDEKVQVLNVKFNLDLIRKSKPIPADLKYYGPIFDFSAEAIFQVQKTFNEGFSYHPIKNNDLLNSNFTDQSIYERIQVKHILTFLLSLVTYISVAGIVGILAGLDYAWLGPLTLALFPRFWGHSFFNPKDIPFAAMLTLGTFLGSCLVGYYLNADREDIKLGINRITLYSFLYGILVGVVTGTRIAGFFLLFFVAGTHLATNLRIKSIYRYFLSFWSLYGLMFVAWMITTTIIHPASWSNPVGWFIETLQYLSKHEWGGTVLFEGQFISAKSLPWNYLPKWLVITIPLIFQIAFFIGLFLVFYRYKQLTNTQRACVLLVLLQVFFLPIISIVRQSTMYDGMRQFMFMLPGIAAFSATSLAWIYQKISINSVRIFGVALIIILSSTIVFDMVALHPYEYIYFNRIFGGLTKAHNQYETDYWGLSMREGMEWINNNAGSKVKVVSSSQLPSSKTFAAPGINVISRKDYEELEQTEPSKMFYYIARPRWDFQRKFPDCSVVYSVRRQNVPLTIVKKCD